jgi:hypothetical protein
MSIIIETFIKCDGNSIDCHENFGVDDRWKTGIQQRKEMKANDWKHIKGKDYCPACLQEMAEQKTDKTV